jgi:hypothetical protein
MSGRIPGPLWGGDAACKITKEQLEYIARRVKKLQDLTKKICEARIEAYLSS